MFKEKIIQDEQVSFYNPYIGMSPRRRRLLEESWAGTFRDEIYAKIDEKPFAVLYSEVGSRPNVPVRLMVSALVLKEMLDYTDEELVQAIEFHLDVRMALGLDDAHDDKPAFSTRSLTRFRTKLFEYEKETGIDLVYIAIKNLLDHFNEKMGTNPNVRRMDSFQVASNIKNLTRFGILYETSRVALKALHKAGVEIPEHLSHYLVAYDSNQIMYYDKETSFDEKSERLINEILETLELVKSSKACEEQQALLERVVKEQLIEDEGKMRFKKNKEEGLNSRTLQSPHDPDATFRVKKGPHIGYVGNVEESATKDGQSMITDYQYEQNVHSDAQFMRAVIDKEEDHSESEDKLTIVTDGAYGSVENTQEAEAKGIEHVPTELSGRKTDDIYADFIFNKDRTEIVECPNGIKPIRCSYSQKTEQCRAVFDKNTCQNCPYYDKCHPQMQKKTACKTLSYKSVARAKTKRSQQGERFNKLRNFRNGSEVIPSVLRQSYNIDRMPVRGLIRTRQLFGFKIGGLATSKYLNFKKFEKEQWEKCA